MASNFSLFCACCCLQNKLDHRWNCYRNGLSCRLDVAQLLHCFFQTVCAYRSMWSFNPETNILLNVPLHGTILTRPLLESELVIGAVILRGHLRIAGHHLGRCDIKDLPKEITVATSRTLSYYKLGASQRVAGDSGFAAYSRYRIGNYKLNTDHSSSSDNIALLVQ